MLKKLGTCVGILMAVMVIIYAFGPKPTYVELSPEIYDSSFEITAVESFIQNRETNAANLKPDNEARIQWAGAPAEQTEFAIVYLPGFTATYFEASPLPENLAKKYGMNLFYARIHGHGIDDIDALKGVDPSQFLESAKEAIAIGKTLGKKVILMACSTGATYATYLAGKDPKIESLILLSPNFALYDSRTQLIDGPWGKQIMKFMIGSEYREIDYTEQLAKYWSPKYHIDAIIALQYLLENTMTEEVYKQVNQKLFIGCYYTTEENQDKVVSVEEMRNMYSKVSTPSNHKKFVEFDKVGNHIIACPAVSKDVQSVELAVDAFIRNIIQP